MFTLGAYPMLMLVCDCSDWGITSVPESERIWANEIIPSAGERWAIFCKGDITISITKCQHCRPNAFHYQKPSWKQATKKLCELNPKKTLRVQHFLLIYDLFYKITILDCKKSSETHQFSLKKTPGGGEGSRSCAIEPPWVPTALDGPQMFSLPRFVIVNSDFSWCKTWFF